MGKRYQNIENATLEMGYGKLTRYNDIRHGGGITDNDSNVWLPILCDPYNNWYNMYSNNDEVKKELIIQIANKEQAKKDWIDYYSGMSNLPGEATFVIVRQNFDDNVKNYEFEDIGRYSTILINRDKYTTIHAKFESSFATGKVLFSKDKKMNWMHGFASSEADAYKKFDVLVGETLKILREL